MRKSIFLDPAFQAAREDRQYRKISAKEWRDSGGRKTPKGMIERGFSRGRRKAGEPAEKSGQVAVLMAKGEYVAPSAVCIAKINESNNNLTQKLERLGLTSNVDQIAVCESKPKGALHGVMACERVIPGDLAAPEIPSGVVAEAILPSGRQPGDSIFQ